MGGREIVLADGHENNEACVLHIASATNNVCYTRAKIGLRATESLTSVENFLFHLIL